MINFSRRNFLTGAVAGGVVAVAAPFTAPLAHASTAVGAKTAVTTIDFFGTGFEPMVAHVVAGTTLHFNNHGSETLQLVGAPDAPDTVRSRVASNGQGSVRFPKPGIYLLYDEATTRFDTKVGQVVARKSASAFPRPAYAIVVATDERGLGLDADKPRIVIPESTMTFRPWSLVVAAGTAIHFDNQDGDMHVAMPSSEPMLMPLSTQPHGPSTGRSELWMEQMNAFAPINLPGDGGKGTLTLSQPGVHHYFCPVHAVYDAAARTFAPLRSYGGFPFIMDGVIVVLPS